MQALSSLSAWKAAGDWLSFRGHRVYFRHQPGPAADCPVLLLIHGFPTASWDWAPIWAGLAENFELLAVDMLGFGWSAKPQQHRYSILEQADLQQAAMAHIGRSRAHILAHDYGDTVAQELLARHVGGEDDALMVDSLCLLNGGLFPECHRARPIQKVLNSPLGGLVSRLTSERLFRRSFAAVFGAHTQPSEAEMTAFWELVSHQQGHRISHRLIKYIDERRAHRTRWVGALMANAVPQRFINGLEDPVSGAHMAQRYRELVPSADVVELPGVGHYPQVEAPKAVLDAIQAFHGALGG